MAQSIISNHASEPLEMSLENLVRRLLYLSLHSDSSARVGAERFMSERAGHACRRSRFDARGVDSPAVHELREGRLQ